MCLRKVCTALVSNARRACQSTYAVTEQMTCIETKSRREHLGDHQQRLPMVKAITHCHQVLAVRYMIRKLRQVQLHIKDQSRCRVDARNQAQTRWAYDVKVHITSAKAPRAVWRARWCQSGKPPGMACAVRETAEGSHRKRKRSHR